MIVRELLTRIGFQVDQRKLDNVTKSVDNLKNKLNGVANAAAAAGTKFTAFATVPIALLGRNLIRAASDAEETASKFGTVFRDISDESQAAADNLRKNFGLSRRAAQQLLGDTGDLLTGFGFTQKSALDLSTQVNELAVDLASFTNFSGGVEGASAALTKSLTGERDALKSLGIVINEENIKVQLLKNSQEGLTFETEQQAKAYATLQIAQRQSQNAIGDYARTSQQFANQQRLLNARLDDLSVSFGKILVPIALRATRVFIKLAEYFEGLSDTTKTVILTIGGLIATIGPLLLIFAGLIKAVLFISSAFAVLKIAPVIALFTKLGAALKFIMALRFGALVAQIGTVITAIKSFGTAALLAQAKFLLIPTAIVAVIAAVAYLGYKLYQWVTGTSESIQAVRGFFIDLGADIIGAWNEVNKWFIRFVDGLVDMFYGAGDAIVSAFTFIGDKIMGFFGGIVDTVAGAVGAVKNFLFGAQEDADNLEISDQVMNIDKESLVEMRKMSGEFVTEFQGGLNKLGETWTGLRNNINAGIEEFGPKLMLNQNAQNVQNVENVQNQAGSPIDKLLSALMSIKEVLMQGFNSMQVMPNMGMAGPAGNFATAGNTFNSASRAITLNSNVNVTVPTGTSDTQREFLRNAARESFRAEYESELERVLYENPELE